MKNVILIHGLNGVSKIYEWLMSELKSRNIQVILPDLPVHKDATYASWSQLLDEYQSYIHDDSIVICHSIGNEFIIKYLSANNLPINTYIGLAGFAELFTVKGESSLNQALTEFLVTDAERQSFISLTRKRYAIYSDNDPLVPYDILNSYPKAINATSILVPGAGHMGKRSGITKLPKLLDLILTNLQ